MRRNILLTLLLVLITTVGVRAEVVLIQKQSVGTRAVTTNQQETILQLQEENKKLKEQLERTEMDKEIQRCRDYVDRRANDINDNLSHWLVILSIVVGAIITILGGGLGVLAPLYLNRKNDKVMQIKLEEATKQAEEAKEQAEKATKQVTKATEQIATATEQVQKATSQVTVATEQAETAKKQANDAKEQAKKAEIVLKEIEVLKRQVDAIQTKINEDKTKAEDAAKEAKVSQLFAEAFTEKDSSRAIELYTQLLALNPDNAKAYNNRGNVKDDLGDKSGALSDYDKAIELNPDYDKAYYNRAVCYRKMAEEEKDEEKKKEYLALAKADEKKYKELTGGEKK